MADELIIIEEPEQIVEVIDAEAESDKAVVVTPESEIKRFESALSAINSRLTAQEEFNKEVTYTESINTDIAYEKSIPSAARLGFINKIGGMSRKGINLFDFSNPADTLVGITSYAFSDDTLTVVGNDTSAYCRVVWDCTEFVKRLQGKYVNFSADSVTFSNTDAKPTMQFVVSTDDGTKYISILNKYFPTGAKALIPTGNITSAALGVYTHNDNTRLANTITLVNPMLLLDENKGKPYEPYTDSLVTSRVESVSIANKTISIPSALKRKEMHGINENVYDYIDIEHKQLVKRCEKRVLDGSYDWKTAEYSGIHRHYINDVGATLANEVGIVSDRFDTKPYTTAMPKISLRSGIDQINIFEDFTDGTAQSWSDWISNNPVNVIYELAEPITEDLTYVLDSEAIANPFNCNGGTITFNQTQAQKVEIPNEVRYLTKK